MSLKAANVSTVTCLHVCMYIHMCDVQGPTHGHNARLLCTACSQSVKLPSDMQMFHCDCDLIRSRTLHYINSLPKPELHYLLLQVYHELHNYVLQS